MCVHSHISKTTPPKFTVAWVRRCIRKYIYVCVFVCPCSKRKTARATDTKVGRDIAHGRPLAFVDPEAKRSKLGLGLVSVAGPRVDATAHFICLVSYPMPA